ncbi:hypothetical protein ACHAXA_006589, partial [Cyclostephanos tholiformis]
MRVYFDYDKDYPDDARICDEVKELQCFTDFTNLDGYATGTAGSNGGGGNGVANFNTPDTTPPKQTTKGKSDMHTPEIM